MEHDLENLFVIFPPGGGGNHLSNLISLTNRFVREVNYTKYDKTSPNAHFSDLRNLEVDAIRNHLDKLKIRSNVFCGHLGEYLWLMQCDMVKYFPNRKFLVVELPVDTKSVAFQRIQNKFPHPRGVSYFYEEQRTLYTISQLKRLYRESDFFSIKAESIFSPDPTDIIDFIENQLCSIIDRAVLSELHTKWFNNITKYLKNSSFNDHGD